MNLGGYQFGMPAVESHGGKAQNNLSSDGVLLMMEELAQLLIIVSIFNNDLLNLIFFYIYIYLNYCASTHRYARRYTQLHIDMHVGVHLTNASKSEKTFMSLLNIKRIIEVLKMLFKISTVLFTVRYMVHGNS